ncbi:MAG: LysM peptidoglycan-binding domain-containing protein [Sulfurovum sp.]|nr:LysM peptidoglycan-binding domain-containing protein [Sulfurovum sp.]
MTECYHYGSKLLRTKEIVYDLDRKKLIRVKTLPLPEKKRYMRVVSVEDMVDKYVKVYDSMRFKGSETTPLKESVSKVLLDKKIKVDPAIQKELLKKTKKPQIMYGHYTVVRGDALSKLAKKFGFKTKELAKMNGLRSNASLRIGQKLKLPFEQRVINALVSAEYKVEQGDTLISIANMFNLNPKILVQFNSIKNNTVIRTGKVIKLPLPYVLAQKKKDEAKKKKRTAQKKSAKVDLRGFGKHKLRVTATAYSSHVGQTDSTPFLAAWNNRLRPGMKIIAVSRDMLTKYGMRNGTKVRIGGLPGYYRVRDKMNKRYKKRIDIYTGIDRRKALRWGRRSVVIYW